jgi:hypothetical protein
MEFSFSIGVWGLTALIVASLAYGVVVELIGETSFGYEWVLTAISAGIGAFIASEFVVGFRDWQPVFDGLAIVPALVTGLIVGGAVAAAARYLTNGRHGAPQAI